jgi:hypothetical protein
MLFVQSSNGCGPMNQGIPTPTPSVPEFSCLTILPLLLAIPIALIIAKKTTKQSLTMKESTKNSD